MYLLSSPCSVIKEPIPTKRAAKSAALFIYQNRSGLPKISLRPLLLMARIITVIVVIPETASRIYKDMTGYDLDVSEITEDRDAYVKSRASQEQWTAYTAARTNGDAAEMARLYGEITGNPLDTSYFESQIALDLEEREASLFT